jgi:hypothetical protein
MSKKHSEALRHKQYREGKKAELTRLRALRDYVSKKNPKLLRGFETEYDVLTSPETVPTQVPQATPPTPSQHQVAPHVPLQFSVQAPLQVPLQTPPHMPTFEFDNISTYNPIPLNDIDLSWLDEPILPHMPTFEFDNNISTCDPIPLNDIDLSRLDELILPQ